MQTTHQTEDSDNLWSDLWRLQCPNGHTTIKRQNTRHRTAPYWCRTCQQKGIDPFFEELKDVQTGEMVSP